MHFVLSELFFEADDVRTVLASRLELNLSGDRLPMTLIVVTEWYNFDSELLLGRAMLRQHDLTESAIAKFLY